MSKETIVLYSAAVTFVNVKLGAGENFPALPPQAV